MNPADQGFPRKRRLLRPAEFDSVLRQSDWRKDRSPVRILARRNQNDGARLGIVTPKRFVRMAHDRNQCRRVVREIFRIAWMGLPTVDIVVMIGTGATPARVRESVLRLFSDLCSTLQSTSSA